MKTTPHPYNQPMLNTDDTDDYSPSAAPPAQAMPTMPRDPSMAHYSDQPPMPPSAALPSPIIEEQGGFTPQWYDRFEELRDHAATLNKFQRPEALAKSYAALERLRGYPGIEDKRRMGAFRRAVGLPEHAEEYSLSRPEDLPDELWDENLVSQMAHKAHEYGVPAAAMEALKDHYCCENKRHLQHYRQMQEERILQADAELQDEWGIDYEDNMAAITSVFARLGMDAGVDVVPMLDNPALRADTSFRRVLLEVAHALGEAPHRSGDHKESRHEAHRIAHDPTHPLHEAYMRTSPPQHKYANEQYDRHAFGRPIS